MAELLCWSQRGQELLMAAQAEAEGSGQRAVARGQ
jgi:hypothetical protein